MLRNIIVATWLCITALSANATEYTDAWVPLGEEGSGTLIVQSESFIILGLWVFDQNGKPVWYSCQITLGANGSTFSGGLYASTGTYYALPWNPAAAGITQVGTCTFVPTDAYNATLTYTFTGAQPIVKQIQRFPLTGYNLAGNYSGSMAGSVTGCQDPGGNIPSFRGRYNLVVTQNGDQSAGLTFTFVDQCLRRHRLYRQRAAGALRQALPAQRRDELHRSRHSDGQQPRHHQFAPPDRTGGRRTLDRKRRRRVSGVAPLLRRPEREQLTRAEAPGLDRAASATPLDARVRRCSLPPLHRRGAPR